MYMAAANSRAKNHRTGRMPYTTYTEGGIYYSLLSSVSKKTMLHDPRKSMLMASNYMILSSWTPVKWKRVQITMKQTTSC